MNDDSRKHKFISHNFGCGDLAIVQSPVLNRQDLKPGKCANLLLMRFDFVDTMVFDNAVLLSVFLDTFSCRIVSSGKETRGLSAQGLFRGARGYDELVNSSFAEKVFAGEHFSGRK